MDGKGIFDIVINVAITAGYALCTIAIIGFIWRKSVSAGKGTVEETPDVGIEPNIDYCLNEIPHPHQNTLKDLIDTSLLFINKHIYLITSVGMSMIIGGLILKFFCGGPGAGAAAVAVAKVTSTAATTVATTSTTAVGASVTPSSNPADFPQVSIALRQSILQSLDSVCEARRAVDTIKVCVNNLPSSIDSNSLQDPSSEVSKILRTIKEQVAVVSNANDVIAKTPGVVIKHIVHFSDGDSANYKVIERGATFAATYSKWTLGRVNQIPICIESLDPYRIGRAAKHASVSAKRLQDIWDRCGPKAIANAPTAVKGVIPKDLMEELLRRR